jgi:cysteine desulfurase / selenocysteine lyase
VRSTQRQVFDAFPVKERVAYFNNASYTPMSLPALDAIETSLKQYVRTGPDDEYYKKLKASSDEARKKLGKLVNVSWEEIVFSESATQSINMIANGFKFKKGDTVITRGGATEHPSNYLPWKYYSKTKGFNVFDVETDKFGVPDLSELDSALKKTKAKLVNMSHVLYNYGTILPAREIGKVAHEREAMFFLDASQSIGAIPVDLGEINCDYAIGTAAKWLCGPLGMGFLFCKPEALDQLEPLNFGANACAYKLDGSYEDLGLPSRLQEGFRNWAYTNGLSAAIDLITSFAVDRIRRKNLKLAQMIVDSFKSRKKYRSLRTEEEDRMTSIIPIESVATSPILLVQKLMKKHIIIAQREIGERRIIRISPHFYNDEREIEALLTELRIIGL